MAKILTDKELLIIVDEVINGNILDYQDQYFSFLKDLGTLLRKHLGADCGLVDHSEELGYSVAFNITEETPGNGGIFSEFDTDVSWSLGKEN